MIQSLHQIGVITRLTFREVQRRRLLWIGLGLGGAFVALFALGMYFIYQDIMQHVSEGYRSMAMKQASASMLMAGMYVINFLIVMITVLTSVGSISGEIGSNTIHTIASKPIRRWEIVMGKWLGFAIMISLYTILMSLALMGIVAVIGGGFIPPHPIQALLILILEGLTILSVTVLGSTVFSTLANGVVIFMLYGVAFVGGWIEQIGTIVNSQVAQDLGIVSSLLLPSEALWRLASSSLQPSGITESITPFAVASQPTPAFVVYSLLYTSGLLILGMYVLGQKDF
ncbi:MAG: ABC transporter permease subunit [Anaerolineae bacterium]|nr:ABC transporter permease subunit [Anaerolineae bacterium]